jgi:hypothetical protein
MDADLPKAALEPAFFDGRCMVEIVTWDWSLYVGLSPQSTPVEYRFQGGLNFSRGIEITGRVRAPSSHRGKTIRVWISPFGPGFEFGADALVDVGRLYKGPEALKPDFQATLLLPEGALSATLTSLNSVWKYLDIWTADDGSDEVSITAFAFSASIHPNLADWAGPELDRSKL